MRLEESRRSENIEDRRGMAIPRGVRIGGAGGLGLLVAVVIAMALGVDPSVLINMGTDEPEPGPAPSVEHPGQLQRPDATRDFVAAVLGETEDTWTEIFREARRQYTPP